MTKGSRSRGPASVTAVRLSLMIPHSPRPRTFACRQAARSIQDAQNFVVCFRRRVGFRPPPGLRSHATGSRKEDVALQAAGVHVERRNWEGVTHEFFSMADVVRDAYDAQQWSFSRLRAALR